MGLIMQKLCKSLCKKGSNYMKIALLAIIIKISITNYGIFANHDNYAYNVMKCLMLS